MATTRQLLSLGLERHGGMEQAIKDEKVLEKGVFLCDKFSLTPAAFVDALEAFLAEHNKNTIGMEDVSKFEQKLHKQSAVAKQQELQAKAHMNAQQQQQRTALKSVTNNINAGATATTPGDTSLTGKRPLSATVTPALDSDTTARSLKPFSSTSSSFSQSAALSSTSGGEAYRSRKDRYQSVASMNTALGSRAEFKRSDRGPLGMRCAVSTSGEDINNCEGRYRYMFTTMEERARNLDKHMLRMQAHMCEKASLKAEDLQPVGIPSPETVWVCGRICCEAETGKINSQAVMLEGSRRESGGRRVKLDLVEVGAYSLFPGQIVLVEGINSSGRKMVVKRIVEGFPSDLPKTAPQKLLEFSHSSLFQGGEPLNICTAAGPFTTSDSLSYEPLMDLMGRILEKKPDVVVLVGPFVDVTQPLLASGDVRLHDYDEDGNIIGSHAASYEVVFIERIVRDALTNLFGEDENLPTNIVLVPSLQDAHHECVFPQPPFGDRDEVKTDYFDQSLGVLDIPFSDSNDSRRRVHLLPNPCMFRANEVLFGVCSTDVLFALSSDEVSHNMPGNRLDRLVAHLLQQQSFCPQFPVPPTSLAQVRPASSLCLPPSPSLSPPSHSPLYPLTLHIQLDLRHAAKWQMQRSPDVLILPSRLAHMARDVLGTVIVNPGSLAKGPNGGTFAEIAIHPLKEEELRTQHLENTKELPHAVSTRTSVNIMKI